MDDSKSIGVTRITRADVASAEKLAGLEFSDAERRLMLPRLNERSERLAAMRTTAFPNSLAPALRFDPRPAPANRDPMPPRLPDRQELSAMPASDEDLAFCTIAQLGGLLRSGQVTSLELTRLSLERLKRYGPRLRCLVTLLERPAVEAAGRADEELAAGVDRGALHGIPYGVKDLLAVPGYPTTWGAKPFREQQFEETATVVDRLAAAGAVPVAKLSLGELAMGDVWFGGKTVSPWNPKQGSSGSSAGSAVAVAAGLVPFAIGSETMGSILSPATRCGVIGHRPSAGLIPRTGAMALSWSLDKLGPFARSVEDCALVLQTTAGPDGRDGSVIASGFDWELRPDPRSLRVGYVEAAFEAASPAKEAATRLLNELEDQGVQLVPVSLPEFEAEPIMTVLLVEAAAAFDELTRSDMDDMLAQQGQDSWPNMLRSARLIPAVDYVQANRLRTMVVERLAHLFESVDAYLCPYSYYRNLFLTNATGNPCVSLPIGFDDEGVPLQSAMTVTGPFLGDGTALSLAATIERVIAERLAPPRRPDLSAFPPQE